MQMKPTVLVCQERLPGTSVFKTFFWFEKYIYNGLKIDFKMAVVVTATDLHSVLKNKAVITWDGWEPKCILPYPGTESETKLLKLSSTWQKDRLSSSSSIFQKISQGKQMCQCLKEQTDELMTKVTPLELVTNHRSNQSQTWAPTPLIKSYSFLLQVQEFSNRIKQDSNCHLQDLTEVMTLSQVLNPLVRHLHHQYKS